MRLKIATTVCMVVGLALMACWPLVMGPKPENDAPRGQLQSYAVRSATFFSILLVVFFAAFVLAWLSLRQTRAEFLAKSSENLQTLIEGTLKDHAEKQR